MRKAKADLTGAGTAARRRPGDSGQTFLPRTGRVGKDHPAVALLGDLDELNCALGVVVSHLKASKSAKSKKPIQQVERVQGELFDLGAMLFVRGKDLNRAQQRIEKMIGQLDGEIAAAKARLRPCRGFVVPGGKLAGAAAHSARAICRRVERTCTAVARKVLPARGLIPYLNRLSEWLFVLARLLNEKRILP
ncbi:MAG: cob(I)yrinic acid a,c-diamide adenosyltransferase [Candidatus Sumerlaeia bacterium]|nr:cob(I)yrinic acid a,c-diamide adenosyltransferase [Candidatus Sumerlaeia bacterium]